MVKNGSEFGMLSTLEQSTGRGVIVGLLENFQQSKCEILAKLESARAATDIGEIKAISHQMYGTCGSLGFRSISLLFHDMNEAAKSANFAEIDALMAAIDKEDKTLELALQAHYPELTK